jgi:CRP-like cAMP-binding protein
MINEDEAVRLKKEKEKVDYDRRQRLNEILLIHPKNRTKAIESELSELLVQFPCFHSVAEDNFDRLIQLSREIYMECLLQDTVIIKQDEEPDNCYLITQGQCKVYVTFKTMRFDKLKLTTKHMCDIGNKTMFGELSLLFNGKRTATVKTMEASYVIIIPKATFVKYMKEPMLKNLSITIKFLKSLSFFDELDPNVLLILASKTILNILQKDTLITKQNKKSKYIYFISTGRVKVVRMIPILKPKREYLEDQAKLPLLYKDPTEEQLKNPDIVHTKLIEIAELGHYECFGEDYNKASNFLLSP